MLQIDMTEEPADEEDRIFLATNKWTGNGYELVTPPERVDVASAAAAAAAISQSIATIGQQIANALGSALGTAIQTIQAADEEQMRRAKLHGLEQFNIQAYDSQARERMLHKQEV